ncbi:type VII secretion protein EccC [Schaalia suimastitidis]|uniref:type VII secretion protein EccC n=1 Tax=Schaalia suimastitidis TaxID=121163 RepID=UPI0004299A97|nr:type VII secretion protein EccC [Schaalia suimastitidis]
MARFGTQSTQHTAPELPTGTIPIQPPPDQVESGGMGNILATMIPMVGSMGVMVFMAMSQGTNTRMLLMAGAMVVAMVSMIGFNIYRQISSHRRKVNDSRREYLAYLAETRTSVRTIATQQRRYINWFLPSPDALVLIAHEQSRLWEREVGDDAALKVRIGTSTQTLSMELEEPQLPPLAQPDVVCHSAMKRFLDAFSTVDDLPFGIVIGDFSTIEVAGSDDVTRSQIRAMVSHLCTFVPPTSLKIAVLCTEDNLDQWEWVKWLPHARSAHVSDALGPARMVCTDAADLYDMLGEEYSQRPAFRPRSADTDWPHLVLITDGANLPLTQRLGSTEGTAGVTVIKAMSTWGPLTSRATLRMILHPAQHQDDPGKMELVLVDQEPIIASPDTMGIAHAEAIARRMTAWDETELPGSDTPLGTSDPKRSADLLELLGLGDIRDFDPDTQWRRREGRDRLRVPFGVTPEGLPVVIDIKESAQLGMGPHGLLIGATGSGKSEVLRTMVIAMALTHSPEQLNFVLVDFKGGATFAGMADLPHVSAMISNLESELSLVDRMEDALRGEMLRRQELLRDAGNYANVTTYEADRLSGKHSFPPLPALFIILDEFSELLTAKPEFLELFTTVGRVGRSMSIHLLLASQRLESGRLRGLDSHLSYRIGLRTFSIGESREVLGVPDAYELPSFPGVGYLKPGTDEMIRFRASYVAAPPPPRKEAATQQAGMAAAPIRVLPFTTAPVLQRDPVDAPQVSETIELPGDAQWADMTQMDIAVARMVGKGTPAHQVWLPPLDVPDTLDSLMPDLQIVDGHGLLSPSWRSRGPLRIPLGVVDVPLEQRRDVLTFDFSGANGHMAVIGSALSGKSTTLRSVVMALSLVHTPQEVQFYIIDLGGGSFTPFDSAAHIAAVATRDRKDLVNRMLAEIEGIIADREAYFRRHKIDSMSAYRKGRAEGRWDDGYGDVFLVVDGWAAMRVEFDGLDVRIQELLTRALSYGVHLILATSRWNDIRMQMDDSFGSVIELRMGDAADSRIDRKRAELIPAERPGRGINTAKLNILVGLPRIDGDHDPNTLSEGVAHCLEQIAAHTVAGPKLRLLPERVTSEDVRAKANVADKAIILGIEENRLGPLLFDTARESHMYLFGDSKSGRTTFLCSLASEIMRTHTPEQAAIILIDPRRTMMGHISDDYLLSTHTTRDSAAEGIAQLALYLQSRLPGDDVSPAQLRDRSWWSGADIWVLVDDYDLISSTGNNPLSPLVPLLAQASDIGLHLVTARRSGGAGRTLYEPVVQTLGELGATCILLSGDPVEGAIAGGVKPMKLPPGRAQIVSRDNGKFMAQMLWTPRQM